MLEDIFSRTPVNKMAAIAVNQSGCDDEMSLQDERECLVKALRQIDREIDGLPKKHRYRAELGRKKESIKQQIIEVNRKMNMQKSKRAGLTPYIVDACKKRFTAHQWESILSEAREAKDADC